MQGERGFGSRLDTYLKRNKAKLVYHYWKIVSTILRDVITVSMKISVYQINVRIETVNKEIRDW